MFRGFYAHAQLLQTINLPQLTEAMLTEFEAYNIVPTNITLDNGDGLFGYSIKAHLFNRLINFTSTATNLEASFARLIRTSDRKIAEACLRKVIGIAHDYLTENCFFEIGLHASFDSQKSRDAFFTPAAKSDLEFVGTLGYKKLQGSDQMIRFQVDQSWIFPDAAYITWTTVGMNIAKLLESEPLWTPFFQMLEPLGLTLKDE
jgi:hypothetical protein